MSGGTLTDQRQAWQEAYSRRNDAQSQVDAIITEQNAIRTAANAEILRVGQAANLEIGRLQTGLNDLLAVINQGDNAFVKLRQNQPAETQAQLDQLRSRQSALLQRRSQINATASNRQTYGDEVVAIEAELRSISEREAGLELAGAMA